MPSVQPVPASVAFVIEVPKGGRIKRGPDGHVEYVSPWPCPFNYGSAPAHPAEDGDPADVVVLGPRLGRAQHGRGRVVAVVRFTDAGAMDDKWVCVPDGRPHGLNDAELALVNAFFRRYAKFKRAFHRIRRRQGLTAFHGIERFDQGPTLTPKTTA